MPDGTYILAFGADMAGVDLKNALCDRLRSDHRVRITDYGVSNSADQTDYPDIGIQVAEAVARGEARRAILVCGTGIGMAITANKIPGIRATVAHDSYSAERSILSNDCQILTLGGRVIGLELAYQIVREWIGYEFDSSSASARKVSAISAYEARGMQHL